MNKNRVLLTGASIVTAEKAGQGALLIDGETIAGVWFFDEDGLAEYESEKLSPEALQSRVNADVTRDLSGKLLMAGAIDAHVHAESRHGDRIQSSPAWRCHIIHRHA